MLRISEGDFDAILFVLLVFSAAIMATWLIGLWVERRKKK